MGDITRNSCNVSTLNPMVVQSIVTNATTTNTQDGSIQININGGTSPYTITWSNGQQGYFLNNLSSGTYTVTVTDYHGDYQEILNITVGFNLPYLDEFIKCNSSLNSDIFVFYDGTSLNIQKAKTASESIRSWYQNKFNNGFGGLLYEGVVGSVENNGENWLWWATYPYLGSLTGGTLSDGTVVKSFGSENQAVGNSVYDSRWCKSDVLGECSPKNPSFNFGTNIPGGFISDVYQRINNGFQLNGTYGVNDDRTQGVPFTVRDSMMGNYETVYGDFQGGVKNYMVIMITDESDGKIGFYHGQVPQNLTTPNKNFLVTNPFELYGEGWNNDSVKEPTNRFTYEYESFLKVWKDIKNSDGLFNGLVYPYIDNNISEIPFLLHSVAAVEGSTVSANTFNNEYQTNINSVGYLNLNLSALTYTNVYSAMTATTAYYNLSAADKKGPGLKNFGWKIDPTVSAYTTTEINSAVEPFFDESSLSEDKVYSTTIDGLIIDRIYNFSNIEGCYSYNQRILSTGQTYNTLNIANSYDDCINCNPSEPNKPIQPKLCLSSNEIQYTFTQSGVDGNNNFVWVNDENGLTISYSISNDRWEISSWTNVANGLMIQNSNNEIPTGSWSNIGVSRPLQWEMLEGECIGIPLTLNALTTDEECEDYNNGSVILTPEGGEPPFVFRVQNVPPYPNYNNSSLFVNLQPGSYVAEVSGSSGMATTTFNIADGSPETEYVATTTYQLSSQNYGTKTWNYAIEFNPPLPNNVTATFDVKLTHQRISRDSGTAIFTQQHTILKNNNLNIPYTTSSSTTTTTNVCEGTVTETNEIFTQIASSVTMINTDSINGTVTQTVIIDSENAQCSPESCQMLGEYITSLQLNNLRLINANTCDTITYPNPLTNINVRLQDCKQ